MSKDGRGTPGRIVTKDHQPRLTLANLLRRRRTDLGTFTRELGLTTHAGLQIWCDRMGVTAPNLEEFEVVFPPTQKVNSPQEGVIVLEPLPVVNAETGLVLPDELVDDAGSDLELVLGDEIPPGEPIPLPQKKPRKKKDGSPTEA
jgi:hypothetical protein